jgi:hypothetical protein
LGLVLARLVHSPTLVDELHNFVARNVQIYTLNVQRGACLDLGPDDKVLTNAIPDPKKKPGFEQSRAS